MDTKFNAWMQALKLVAVSHFGFSKETKFSPVHWKVYYDEGLNVFHALQTDFKYL